MEAEAIAAAAKEEKQQQRHENEERKVKHVKHKHIHNEIRGRKMNTSTKNMTLASAFLRLSNGFARKNERNERG